MSMPPFYDGFSTHSSTWSIIRSLSTLSPPPSYPSLDQLSSLCSSGDIPLILHPSVKIPSSSSFDDITAWPPLDQTDVATSSLFSTSASATTLDSAGTFGPVRVTLRRPTVVQAAREAQGGGIENNSKRSSKPSSTKVKRPVSGANLRRPLADITKHNEAPRPSESPTRPKLTPRPAFDMTMHRAGLHISPPHEPSPPDDHNPLPANRRDTLPASFLAPTALEDEIQTLFLAPSQSMSTLPSPVFAPPSILSDLSPESSPNRARPNKLKKAISKGMNFVHAKQSTDTAIGTSPTRYTPTGATDSSSKRSRFGRSRNGSTSTTDSATSSGYYDAPPPLPSLVLSLPSVSSVDQWRYASLPVTMAWLKDVVVELFIDQEGFRVARPTFHLAGYTGPPSSDYRAMSLPLHHTSAQADFMPRKRESFTFHHSTLDTAPILRRVTINGDDSRDYTSRQATLSLKSEGAYSVRGTETAHGHGNEAEVLAWRFDYFVRDKLSPAGRPIPGEKTLTPLCFSCAPGLLLSTHAKKVRLVHVVKKSVVAKLTAEKVLPPAPPAAYLRASEPSGGVSAETGTVKGVLLKGHRRVRSHGFRRSLDKNVDMKTLSPSMSYHPGSHYSSPPKHTLYGDDIPPLPPLPPLPLGATRHIVPKDVLTSLLAESPASGTRQRHSLVGDGSARPVNPLSPPSRRHARRASDAGAIISRG